jgi:hypothetical protein
MYKNLVGNPEGMRTSRNLDVGWRIILKIIFERLDRVLWTGISGSG